MKTLKMKYNHMFDVAFTIDSNKPSDEITVNELINALKKRVSQLTADNCIEAFGHCDTFLNYDD